MESCNYSISLYIQNLIISNITSYKSQWLCLQGYHCLLKRLHGPKETTLFCPLAFYVKQVSWWNADKIVSCFPALKNCSTMLMLETHKRNTYVGLFDLFCWVCFLIKLQYNSYWNLSTEKLNCSLLCRYRTGEWGNLMDILLYFPYT